MPTSGRRNTRPIPVQNLRQQGKQAEENRRHIKKMLEVQGMVITHDAVIIDYSRIEQIIEDGEY